MGLFGVIVVWIIFGAIFFFILYHVVFAAINDSSLAKDVREIKELLAARHAGPSGSPAAASEEDLLLTEACPGCGHKVHPQETTCPACGLRLG